MRVALVSDMHGNAVAFRAALADLEERKPDLIVSLGDVAQGGPQPLECVELLQELGCPCVFGNSDAFLLTLDFGAEPIEDEEHRERLLTTGCWSQEQLAKDGLAFLESFKPTVRAGNVLCCHATPGSNEDVILPTTPSSEVEGVVADVDAAAIAAGHVHLQWLRRFGETLWFCVGSVGLVYEHKEPLDDVPYEPFSEYALLDDETLAVEFRRVPFDLERLIAAARAKDFPDVERWAGMWKR
jgi:predicted phosphodiesterase